MLLMFGSSLQLSKFQMMVENVCICEIFEVLKRWMGYQRHKYRKKFMKDWSTPLVRVCVASFKQVCNFLLLNISLITIKAVH